MAKVNKTILKTYFESGDIPTQNNYIDLIDSQFNLAETSLQIISGTLSASAANFEYLNLKKAYLPGVGVGEAKVGSTFAIGRTLEISGSVIADTGSFSHLSITQGTVSSSGGVVTHHVTASGNVSSSSTGSFGHIRTPVISSPALVNIIGGSNGIKLTGHAITSSAVITSSRGITASAAVFSGHVTASNIKATGEYYITSNNLPVVTFTSGEYIFGDTGGSGTANKVQILGTNFKLNGSLTASAISSSTGITASAALFSGNVTSSGNISSSATITGLTGSFGYVDGTNINFTSITASGDLLLTTGSSGIRSAGSLIVTLEDITNLGASTDFQIKYGVSDSTIFKVDESGFVYLYGGIVFGEGADQNFTSDGNMTFVLDYDDDETGQSFTFKNKNTVLMELDESDGLNVSANVTGSNVKFDTITCGKISSSNIISSSAHISSRYNILGYENVNGGNGVGAATTLNPDVGVSFCNTDSAENYFTLSDGVSGQVKHIVHKSRTNSVDMVLRPQNLAAGTTLTSDREGRGITLIFGQSAWHVIGDLGEFVLA